MAIDTNGTQSGTRTPMMTENEEVKRQRRGIKMIMPAVPTPPFMPITHNRWKCLATALSNKPVIGVLSNFARDFHMLLQRFVRREYRVGMGFETLDGFMAPLKENIDNYPTKISDIRYTT